MTNSVLVGYRRCTAYNKRITLVSRPLLCLGRYYVARPFCLPRLTTSRGVTVSGVSDPGARRHIPQLSALDAKMTWK